MPGKSRRRRGRHLPRSKRRKGVLAPVAQPSAVTQGYETAAQAEVAVPRAKAPTPRATVAQPPNVAAELRRIGIVAGIILVVLVVSVLIFS
jgi:hypothetical protein